MVKENNEKWYQKLWKYTTLVCSTIWGYAKKAFNWFISVFNSWHKLAAIILAIFTWNWLELSLFDKLGAFALFGVLAVLIFDIAKESK